MTLSLFLIEVAIEILLKLDSKALIFFFFFLSLSFFFCVKLEHEVPRSSTHCSPYYYCFLTLALCKLLKVAELILYIGIHLEIVGCTLWTSLSPKTPHNEDKKNKKTSFPILMPVLTLLYLLLRRFHLLSRWALFWSGCTDFSWVCSSQHFQLSLDGKINIITVLILKENSPKIDQK